MPTGCWSWSRRSRTDTRSAALSHGRSPTAPETYTRAQLRAIVGIELMISHVEGKAKMSQNQPERNRTGVVAGLKESTAPQDQLVADRVDALGSTNANARG